jgi:kynureninase
MLDLPGLTRRARDRGGRILWDCSHSAGIIDHRFWAYDIDFAFGCTYKYLNGGPGSPGWLYVHRRMRDRLPGLAGWFGCEPTRQFDMAAKFHPAADAGRFLISTPSILSLAPLLGSLRLINEVGISNIREKSLLLTCAMRMQIEFEHRLDSRFGVRIITPHEDVFRGGHLTLQHAQAGKLSRALRARGVIPDFRPPNLLRLAPSPLFTSLEESVRAVEILEDILRTGAHEQMPDSNALVT